MSDQETTTKIIETTCTNEGMTLCANRGLTETASAGEGMTLCANRGLTERTPVLEGMTLCANRGLTERTPVLEGMAEGMPMALVRYLMKNPNLPQPGFFVLCRDPVNQAAIIRRIKLDPKSNLPIYEVITKPTGSPGHQTVALRLMPDMAITFENRPSLAAMNISGERLLPGSFWFFPAIFCRLLSNPLDMEQYTLPGMPEGEYVRYGQITSICHEGCVVETDHGRFFMSTSELRHPVSLSEDPEVRARQVLHLEAHYKKISTICLGDEVALFENRYDAATASIQGMDTGVTTYKVISFIYQVLDIPGARAVIQGPDGKLLTVMRFNLVLVKQVLICDGREKVFGGLPTHYSANPELLSPDQPEGLQDPNNLPLGSAFVADDNRAYRVVARLPDGYLVTNIRRHPGVLEVVPTNPPPGGWDERSSARTYPPPGGWDERSSARTYPPSGGWDERGSARTYPPSGGWDERGSARTYPLTPSNIWIVLKYVGKNEVAQISSTARAPSTSPLLTQKLGTKRPRDPEDQEVRPKPLEIKIVYDNLTGLYTIADGYPVRFDSLNDAVSMLHLAKDYAALIQPTTTTFPAPSPVTTRTSSSSERANI